MNGNGTTIFDQDWSEKFEWYEYMVFAALLAVSCGIGIFYGFFGSKNKTNEEFLMAGRTMPVFPVALSVLCSFVSAVTLLGNPVEIYFYGLQYIINAFSFIILGLALAYLYVPVYFKLQLTSVFEYFEMRYNQKVRIVISLSQIVHALIYMPLTVYGPALALEEDALQAFVMLGSMLSVIIVGVKEAGGFSNVWKISEEGRRTDVLNFDWDPRTRHTFYTSVIGGYFNWIALFGATQAQIQRYLSVPTLAKARQVILVTVIGLMVIVVTCSYTGLVIYANYVDCDPIKLKAISSADQLLPLFVMDKLGDIPILPGLFVAGLTAGSLSSVSSTLNSLAAIITEDYVKKLRPNLNQFQLGFVSKISSVISGLIAFAMIFVIASVGNILPFASLLHGTFIGPILGAFSLGMFFPWTNWLGVLMGLIPSLAFTLFIGIGSIVANNDKKLPDQKLGFSIEGCFIGNETETDSPLHFPPTDWKNEEYSGLINLLSMSYLWQPVIPVVCTIFFGLLFSLIVLAFKKPSVRAKEKYFSIPVLKMWKKIFGEERIRQFVEFEDEDNNTVDVTATISQSSVKKPPGLNGFSIPEIKISPEEE